MTKKLSKFEKVESLDGVYCATNGSLRCTAIKLDDGSICLFSPVSGLTEDVVDSIESLGDVSILFAPNHYHNKGLVEYINAFPKALLVASEGARPRLQKITGSEFELIHTLTKKLPSNIEIIDTAGLKTGESWIKIKKEKCVTWIVVDAFCSTDKNNTKVSDEPQILGTFPKFGIKELDIYIPWLREQIERDQPTMIVPCHGSLIFSEALPSKLRRLNDEVLKKIVSN